MWLLTLLSAAIFCFITFFAGGGLPPLSIDQQPDIVIGGWFILVRHAANLAFEYPNCGEV